MRLPRARRGARRRPAAPASARCSATGSPGGDELRRAGRGDLGEGADVGEQQRQPEGQRRREHAGPLDLAVGQHGQVGAAEDGRRLPAVHEPLDEPHPRAARPRAAPPCPSADGPTIHSSAPSMPSHARTSTSRPLYGRRSPKHRTTGPSAPSSSGGSGSEGDAREVVEHAVRDDLDPRGVNADLAHEPAAAVLGEHDDGVHATQQPRAARRPGRAGARAAGRRGRSGRSAARAAAGRRAAAREPLEMHDVGRPGRGAPVGEHVRDVAREARHAAQRAPGRARGATVEALLHLVARRSRRSRRRGTRSSRA